MIGQEEAGMACMYNIYIYTFIGSPSITSLSLNRNTTTLTCISTHGPATWKKNDQTLDIESSDYHECQRLVNAETSTYETDLVSDDLAMFVGVFTCTVSNNRGTVEKTLELEGGLNLIF